MKIHEQNSPSILSGNGSQGRSEVQAQDNTRAASQDAVWKESDKERFWSKVNKNASGCWLWIGSMADSGYGAFSFARKTHGAHRASWMLHFGSIPYGLCVLHNCPDGDNPLCVNPGHLWLGTHQDNSDDMIAKGRSSCSEAHSAIILRVVARGDRNGSRTHPESLARGNRHGSRLHPEMLARGDRHGSRTHPERVPRGEGHGNAKLTEKSVIKIRRLHASGGTSCRKLAKEFEVGHATINDIINLKRWSAV